MTKTNHIKEFDTESWECPIKYGRTYANKKRKQVKHFKKNPWDCTLLSSKIN